MRQDFLVDCSVDNGGGLLEKQHGAWLILDSCIASPPQLSRTARLLHSYFCLDTHPSPPSQDNPLPIIPTLLFPSTHSELAAMVKTSLVQLISSRRPMTQQS